MNWIIREGGLVETLNYTAGVKARDDLDAIIEKLGAKPLMVSAPQDERINANFISKFLFHKKVASCWEAALKKVETNDTVIFQFPVINHTFYLSSVIKNLNKRNIKTVAYIHDLEYLRASRRKDLGFSYKWRINKEELSVLDCFTKIIVHNTHMRRLMNEDLNIPNEKMVDLEIFDYLIPEAGEGKSFSVEEEKTDNYSCIIAGNLSRKKAEYVYHLPSNVKFGLYGPNYSGNDQENINYHGTFPPDELPYEMEGSFGLIWDGDSADTCSGIWGEYLQFNNPHKTSLYLASGIPVIIWSKAALSDFVKDNQVGVTIDSLEDICDVFSNISDKEYKNMKRNAKALSRQLKKGYFTEKALKNSV